MARLSAPVIARLVISSNLGRDSSQPFFNAVANIAQQEVVATWVAIALAESGGRTDATNQNSNGTQDTGLFQVNDVNKGVAGMSSNVREFRTQMKDVVKNIQAAGEIFEQRQNSGRNGWSAWSAWSNGSYRNHMAAGRRAARNPASASEAADALRASGAETPDRFSGDRDPFGAAANDAIDGVVGAAGTAVEAAQEAIGIVLDAAGWVTDRDNIIRVVMVGGGVVLAAIALGVVLKPAATTVAKNVPAARALR